jgi:hypothetical protein
MITHGKMWGPTTWVLFHTLAEKINEKDFSQEKNNLLNIVRLVCSHLPCPYCREHAIEDLNKYKGYHQINTKEDLKKFLFEFHNLVNVKRKSEEAVITVLENYKKYNLLVVMNVWLRHFRAYGMNPQVIKEEQMRTKAKNVFKKYMEKNREKFGV